MYQGHYADPLMRPEIEDARRDRAGRFASQINGFFVLGCFEGDPVAATYKLLVSIMEAEYERGRKHGEADAESEAHR